MAPAPLTPPPRRSLRADLALAVMPTVTVLLVFALVENLSHRKLLFASLASSAFLIYLDPEHETTSVRTVVAAQGLAAGVGFAAYALGSGNAWVAGTATVLFVLSMIALRIMHPPAVSTVLSFAISAGTAGTALLFGACVLLIVGLALGQQALLRRLRRLWHAHGTKHHRNEV